MMIRVLRWVIRPVLFLWFEVERRTGRGAAARGTALASGGSGESGNHLKTRMRAFFVRQFHESSCSVASVACAVNSLLALQGRPAEPPVTQQDLLDRVKAGHWKERMSPQGHNGRKGLPLATLGEVAGQSLAEFGIRAKGVEVIPAPGPSGQREFQKQVRSLLLNFEFRQSCLVIAHFDQGCFVPEFHIPHISPVGGYDPATDRVEILDVDPEQDSPYTVSLETFCRGVSSNYFSLFRWYGYNRGGLVVIRL